MIVINDIQVLLTPMEWTFGPSLYTYVGYVSDGMDSIVWSGRSKKFYLSCFSFETLKEMHDSNQ